VKDIEPSDVTQEQTTTVLGLQSGNSGADVEAKLRGSYSGTSAQITPKRRKEKKETKKHARHFHKMTQYFSYNCKRFKSHRRAPEDGWVIR
jgi:hypothetical protein